MKKENIHTALLNLNLSMEIHFQMYRRFCDAKELSGTDILTLTEEVLTSMETIKKDIKEVEALVNARADKMIADLGGAETFDAIRKKISEDIAAQNRRDAR